MENTIKYSSQCEGTLPIYSPDVFPIVARIAWPQKVSPTVWAIPTEADFEGLAECGFNYLILLASTVGIVEQALSYAQKFGIKCVLQQPYHNSDTLDDGFVGIVKEIIRAFPSTNSEDDPLAGYLMMEEPYYDWVVESGRVRKIYDTVRKLDPNRSCYLDLAYSMNIKFVGNISNYDEYLNKIQEWYHPSQWSYNYNPLITRNGATYVQLATFYEALKSYNKISSDSNKPFWAHCNCEAYVMKDYSYSRPAPTIGVLRFETFSALAFGAQGIVFRSYAQQENNLTDEYLTAPINTQRERTSLWYLVQTLASEIARYTPVFLGSKVQDVNFYPSMGNSIPPINPNPSPLIKFTPEDEKGIIVSKLTNESVNYHVIVNRDPFHSQKITITYLSNYTNYFDVVELTPNFMQDAALQFQPSEILERTITLEPGGYAIVRWTMK